MTVVSQDRFHCSVWERQEGNMVSVSVYRAGSWAYLLGAGQDKLICTVKSLMFARD